MSRQCISCGGKVRWDPVRGWVHELGGGTYVMYCPDCYWHGAPFPSPAICPQCGSIWLRDDHVADAEPTMREINWPTDEEEFVRVIRQAGWEEA